MDVRLRREALWIRAVEIFGSESKAASWFHTRLSELANSTPEDVLERNPDTDLIDVILDRIEYGVFS